MATKKDYSVRVPCPLGDCRGHGYGDKGEVLRPDPSSERRIRFPDYNFLCLHLMKCYHPPQVVQQWVDSLPEEHRGLLGDGPFTSCKDIARAFKKM